MSDSSSSDGGNDCFKEAIDPTLFSNELFQLKAAAEEKQVSLPPSRRNQQNSIKNFNPLQIRVTPEFRYYVSKHLHKLLDKNIDDTEELEINKRKKLKCKNENKGVKLLRTSNNYLNDQKIDMVQKKPHRRNKQRKLASDTSSSDEEKRAKEVAVTADWILSGKATEGWAPCTKGKLEVVVVKPYEK